MHLVMLLAMLLPPTTSTGPSAPRHRGGIVGPIRVESTPAPPNASRGVELAGQMRQLDERIDDLRDSGQISRREARNMRRDARAISHAWWRYGSDGLSDSEADELQSRLLAANSLARPSPARRGR